MLRKSEASLEFMVFLGIILLFFVFFLIIIGLNNNDIRESTIFANADNILNTVTNEINTASRIQGYHREFFIPEKLVNGEAYTITYNNELRIVKIEWSGGRNVMGNIITNRVNGIINAGYNKIKNLDGEVSINAS